MENEAGPNRTVQKKEVQAKEPQTLKGEGQEDEERQMK